ncbi:putative bifunctional diguanylate cyclase/phosphodiesterase, partial [Pelagibacterium montanilacus]|uniref:putative bifunctional diguanylate cyclase/phosphodiesterase n=2 Tax=Pelagibacterium montanilacus TaxID=2185280 RepID=UPI0013DFDE31
QMAFLQQWADVSPDAMIVADANGLIVHWNPAAESMFGLPAEEALGTSLDVIIPEPMRGAHAKGMERLLAGGQPRIVGTVLEVTAQHSDGSHFPIEMSLSMWTQEGEARFGAIVRDVSKRRANDDRLHHLAHFDQLTLLPNRTSFLENLNNALGQSVQSTVLLVDLDRFKEVNDQLGHAAGDAVLIEAALRIRRCVPTGMANVARLGSDKFSILLTGETDPSRAGALATVVRRELRRPFDLAGRLVWVGCSIGIGMSPSHGDDAATLIGSADLALYEAKAEGGDGQRSFVPALKTAAVARRSLEIDLREAWEARQFEVFYQPQIRLEDRQVVGAEALLRWRHPERGLLAPGAFLSTLENSSLAAPVGTWVLEAACRQGAAWNRQASGFLMGVNLFGAQLKTVPLTETVRSTLSLTQFPARQLELEITENIMLADDECAKDQLNALHDMGVGLAFDDFGTGYASLAFLKQFPITRLKIDRSFVSNVRAKGSDAAIVQAVLMLARKFGLSVIAEGVETEEQEKLLKKWRCPHAQGYLYGKPVAATAFAISSAFPHNRPSSDPMRK